jgi:hypothetical protein
MGYQGQRQYKLSSFYGLSQADTSLQARIDDLKARMQAFINMYRDTVGDTVLNYNDWNTGPTVGNQPGLMDLRRKVLNFTKVWSPDNFFPAQGKDYFRYSTAKHGETPNNDGDGWKLISPDDPNYKDKRGINWGTKWLSLNEEKKALEAELKKGVEKEEKKESMKKYVIPAAALVLLLTGIYFYQKA